MLKKWFNNNLDEKTIIGFIVVVVIALSLIGSGINEILKNNESSNYYQNNSSSNSEYKNENSVSDTKKETEPFENANDFQDIKNEVKDEIKDEAKKRGISLTEEQADKLTDYEITRRTVDNLENDPALRKEFDEALSNVKD